MWVGHDARAPHARARLRERSGATRPRWQPTNILNPDSLIDTAVSGSIRLQVSRLGYSAQRSIRPLDSAALLVTRLGYSAPPACGSAARQLTGAWLGGSVARQRSTRRLSGTAAPRGTAAQRLHGARLDGARVLRRLYSPLPHTFSRCSPRPLQSLRRGLRAVHHRSCRHRRPRRRRLAMRGSPPPPPPPTTGRPPHRALDRSAAHSRWHRRCG
mmetsp:Transcript_40610/g.107279  ORF Transcript_40610/g.107279 Transcript_40610/m.107279 type:complete len:214 (+) Transcript_40610:56-697(+)